MRLGKVLYLNSEKCISRAESNTFKGIAIMLIILGHNHILAPIGGTLYEYLYGFHFLLFFILPYFYYNNSKSLTRKNFLDLTIRCFVPYVVFFIFCYILYHIYDKTQEWNMKTSLLALLNIGGLEAKDATGFHFLWFLPCFYLASLLRPITIKYWYVSTPILLLFFLNIVSFSLREWPFYSGFALYYTTFGVFALLIRKYCPYSMYILASIFIVLSYMVLLNHQSVSPYIFVSSGFFTIWFLSKLLCRVPFIQSIGRYSLPIYMTHVILYNLFEKLLPNSFYMGILIFLLTLIGSFLLSRLIFSQKYISYMFFPHSMDDFLSVFSKRNHEKMKKR